jgi:hypothetical protein
MYPMRARADEIVVVSRRTGWHIFYGPGGLRVEVALERDQETLIRDTLTPAETSVRISHSEFGTLPKRQRLFRPDLEQSA